MHAQRLLFGRDILGVTNLHVRTNSCLCAFRSDQNGASNNKNGMQISKWCRCRTRCKHPAITFPDFIQLLGRKQQGRVECGEDRRIRRQVRPHQVSVFSCSYRLVRQKFQTPHLTVSQTKTSTGLNATEWRSVIAGFP